MKRGIITVESEAMRDVVHNLGIHSGIISPTSLAASCRGTSYAKPSSYAQNQFIKT